MPELDRQCAFQGAKLPAENLDASEFEIKMTYRTYEIIDNVTIFYYEIKVLDVANSGDAASALSKAVLGVEKCTEVFVSYNFSDFQAVDPAVDEDTCIEGVVVPAAVQPGDSVNVQIKVVIIIFPFFLFSATFLFFFNSICLKLLHHFPLGLMVTVGI